MMTDEELGRHLDVLLRECDESHETATQLDSELEQLVVRKEDRERDLRVLWEEGPVLEETHRVYADLENIATFGLPDGPPYARFPWRYENPLAHGKAGPQDKPE